MNKQEQRIAIAEACGWKCSPLEDYQWECPNSGDCEDNVPDYLNDLNAMHEAEKVAINHGKLNQDDYLYFDTLVSVCLQAHPFNATAVQRAEAFLKTLNLWK